MAEETTAMTVSETSGYMQIMQQIATNPTLQNVEVLERLMAAQEKWEKKQAEKAFDVAYMALQRVLPTFKKTHGVYYPVDKNKPDGEQKLAFKFVKKDAMDRMLPPLLDQYGFTLSYDCENSERGTVYIAILKHIEGHIKTARTPPFPLDTSGGKNNLQGGGSAMSYGQRYSAKFVLDLKFADEDDDGEGAHQFVTAAQLEELEKLIVEAKADRPRFLKTLKVVKLDDVRAAKFAEAKGLLENKIRANKKKADDGFHEGA